MRDAPLADCRQLLILCIAGLLASVLAIPANAAEPARLKVLFLGDQGHHQPAPRYRQLQPVLARRGIDLNYTENLGDLNPKTLGEYDSLVIYANVEKIEPAHEKALLDYVKSGKGFVPLHCASYCFHNSPKYIALVGAQFQRHGTGIFTTRIADREHPVFKGYATFESWDETYVHHKHNEKDRIVLEYRDEGDSHEPWTWVRTQGKGRVFYTAWGHDDRTWGHPDFQSLVERGIRWAAGRDPAVVPTFVDKPRMTELRTDVEPFEYVEADVPFYPAGKQWGTVGEPIKTMQKPLSPAESLKHFVTPVEFEVELFAAEPDIGKPIAMAWDERGRLWLAETVDYPNEMQPRGKGRDRIRICEDTDGDGKADKFTVFAEKLSIPTSLVIAQGGLIVTQAPDTLFLKDTDGDDVADVRTVLFTGWGTQDTHAGPSNLRFGVDNWIYGMVGYSGFEGTIGGEKHSFRQGFFRFRPDGSKVEFLRNTNNNSWGVGLSEEGVLFGSTANGNPSEYMPIANRYYESVRGWSSTVLPGIADSNKFEAITDNVRQVDWHGGFTAGAGHALYTARVYPREYWNRTAFVCEPTGHLIATFCIQENGSGYRSRNRWNLVASDDEWSSPIMAEVGPDGNVWFIDWYNYIVQHNPTPAGFKTGKGNAYETDLRDKTHGRIYRVVHRGEEGKPVAGPKPKPMSLANATTEQLVTALKHDNAFWRLQAQRLLIERAPDNVTASLIELTTNREIDEVGNAPGAMHALWTLKGLGALDDKAPNPKAKAAAIAALKHPSAGVRRNALLVLPADGDSAKAIVDSGIVHADVDDQVRLAALLALADSPESSSAASEMVRELADPYRPFDRWLRDGLTSAAAHNAFSFLSDLCRNKSPRLTTPEILERVQIVAEHFARTAHEGQGDKIILAVATAPVPTAEAIVTGLERGWPKDKPPAMNDRTERALMALLKKVSPAAQGRVVGLGVRWNSAKLKEHAVEIAAAFLAQVRDEQQPDKTRVAAAAEMIEFQKSDKDAAEALLTLISPRTPPDITRGFLEALGKSEASGVGATILEHLGSITPAARTTAVRVLLSRTDWTPSLLGALDAGQLQMAELSLDQKQGLATHPDKKIRDQAKALLARGGGLPDPDRQKVLDSLLALTEEKGDAVVGKEVYKKHCGKCHIHGNEGTRIGPDLTGVAVHPKHELLTNIIDPSRSVEGNFRVYTVVTNDGKIMSGLLASENKTAIEIIDSEAKKHSIQREDIDELNPSTKSLMPEGFEKTATKPELVNLLEFLAQRGKYLPLDLRKAATVVSTKGMFFEDAGDVERMIFDDWSPKTFEGIPFLLVDPQGDRVANAILLNGPLGVKPPKMPKSVTVPCNAPAKAIHLLSGVSGWGHPVGEKGTVSMIVRLHYADGKTEDHPLKNGEQFADYIRRVDVPGSKFAYALRGQQLRYLAVQPQRREPIKEIEFVKGTDQSAPIVMAVTVETPSANP
ncbi:MAG: c-type cytochrome [Planctomycetaceae bacterium]|nr:c-type cytochrome [Planctomycetaceae bacterium]